MSDKMIVACPHCDATLNVSIQLQNKIVSCAKCKQQFRIGELDPIEPVSPLPTSPPQPTYSAGNANFQSNPPYSATQNVASHYAGPQASRTLRTRASAVPMSERDRSLFQTGLFFAVLPVLAGVLPLFGLQLRRLAGAGEYASLIAMLFGLVGAGLIFYGRRHQADGIFSGIGAGLLALLFGIGGFFIQGHMNREASVMQASGNQGALPPTPMSDEQRAQQAAKRAEFAKKAAESSRRFEEESFKELENMLQNDVPALPPITPPEMRPGRTVGDGPSLTDRTQWMENGRMMGELIRRAGMGIRNFSPYRLHGKDLEETHRLENLVGIRAKTARLYNDGPVTALCMSYLGRELILLPIELDTTDFKHIIKPANGETLVGLRFAFDNNLIVGVQGLVQNNSNSPLRELQWLGQSSSDVRTSMNPDPSQCGMICYSDLGKLIGFAWVRPK